MGIYCVVYCSGLMAVLIVTGVMNLVGMALVATAIMAGRLFRNPRSIDRAIGAGMILFAFIHLHAESQ
jgi:predicted metal-binding membrane protein